MINENTTLYDLYNDESLSEIKDCLIAGGENFFLGETGKLSLKEFNEKMQPTWGYVDMLTGLFGVRDAFARGGKVIPVYGKKEIENDEDKRKVKLVFFPAKIKKEKRRLSLRAERTARCAILRKASPSRRFLRKTDTTVFACVIAPQRPKVLYRGFSRSRWKILPRR